MRMGKSLVSPTLRSDTDLLPSLEYEALVHRDLRQLIFFSLQVKSL